MLYFPMIYIMIYSPPKAKGKIEFLGSGRKIYRKSGSPVIRIEGNFDYSGASKHNCDFKKKNKKMSTWI